ncbi:hypothetical protein LCGC14_0423120 [marine sediment metagenome]|uniref:Uncharacterized protein n=1 Tax=marine sediment metagenome TaxID=412755 RepID=A0A0F9SWL9_9ZZZZ
MKNFSEWWDKHRASRSSHTCQSARRENLGMLADEEIWRAALKKVLKQLDIIYSGDFENSDIVKWIKEELE